MPQVFIPPYYKKDGTYVEGHYRNISAAKVKAINRQKMRYVKAIKSAQTTSEKNAKKMGFDFDNMKPTGSRFAAKSFRADRTISRYQKKLARLTKNIFLP